MDEILRIKIKESLGGEAKMHKKPIKLEFLKDIKDFLVSGPDKTKQGRLPHSIKDYGDLAERARLGVSLGEEETGDDNLLAATTVFNEAVLNMVPVNTSSTIYGVKEIDPSDFEKMKLIRQMRVVEDPKHVLELLESGMISPLEVETLSTTYPEYYAMLVGDTLEAISEYSGSNEELPSPSVTRALSTLLQVPRVTPNILREIKEEREGGQPADLDVGAEAAQTAVSEVLDGKV